MTLYPERVTPVVMIRVNGKDRPDLQAALVSFRYNECAGKRDSAHMVLSDGDGTIFDNGIAPNDVMEVAWGWRGNMTKPRSLVIKKILPNYDASAPRAALELSVTGGRTKNGKAPSELHRVQSSRHWGKVSSSEVAKALAKRHGLKAEIENSDDVDDSGYIQPATISDWAYLAQLAEDIDFEFFIDRNKLYYRSKPYDERPRRVFWYRPRTGDTLMLSFNPVVKVVAASTKARGLSSQEVESLREALEKSKAPIDKAAAEILAETTNETRDDLNSAKTTAEGLAAAAAQTTASVNIQNLSAAEAAQQAKTDVENGLKDLHAAKKRFQDAKKDQGKQVFHEKTKQENDDIASSECAGVKKNKDGKVPTGATSDAASRLKLGLGDKRSQEIVGSNESSVLAADSSSKKRDKVACAKQAQKVERAVESRATFIGDPEIRARVNYTIMGVSKKLSGSWYAKSAVHNVFPSYTVELTLKRGSLKKLSKSKGTKTNGKSDGAVTDRPQTALTLTLDDRRQKSVTTTRPSVGAK